VGRDGWAEEVDEEGSDGRLSGDFLLQVGPEIGEGLGLRGVVGQVLSQ